MALSCLGSAAIECDFQFEIEFPSGGCDLISVTDDETLMQRGVILPLYLPIEVILVCLVHLLIVGYSSWHLHKWCSICIYLSIGSWSNLSEQSWSLKNEIESRVVAYSHIRSDRCLDRAISFASFSTRRPLKCLPSSCIAWCDVVPIDNGSQPRQIDVVLPVCFGKIRKSPYLVIYLLLSSICHPSLRLIGSSVFRLFTWNQLLGS